MLWRRVEGRAGLIQEIIPLSLSIMGLAPKRLTISPSAKERERKVGCESQVMISIFSLCSRAPFVLHLRMFLRDHRRL